MAGLILEGVTGTGKTALFHAIQAWLVENRASSTKLLLSEHYSERVLGGRRKAGALVESDVLDHLGRLLDAVRYFEQVKDQSPFRGLGGPTTVMTVIERFLLGHMVNMTAWDPGRWDTSYAPAIEELYRSVDTLGLRTVVLTVPADRLSGRIGAIRQHRNAAWRTFIESFGSEQAAFAHFQRWQAVLLALVEGWRSVLRPEVIDVGDFRWPHDYTVLARRLCEATFATPVLAA